jgi:hypothetical protein
VSAPLGSSQPTPAGGPADPGRWKNRWLLAGILTVAVSVVPIAASFAVAYVVERNVTQPSTVAGFALWWLALLGVCSLAFFVVGRVTRRALPLALLLKMNLAFPGQAPKRLAAARRAGSVRDLHRRVEEARLKGVADEPTLAAERIVVLAATLNAHDRTTRGHAERVRALTDMVAEELRLPDADRDRLRWSSLLHDIGKLTVHPEVLNKAEALSDDEWEVIRRHPLEGARLTAPLASWLGPWANTIAEHHERFDGKGYPFGLSGRQISLGGRVVAVADSYDVMTSLRSYKRPMSPDKARLELAACAGTQFDPDIVRAFLAVSIWRLRLAAPLSWLGSLPFGRLVAGVGRLAGAAGHTVLAGVVASAGVVGLGLGPLAGSLAAQAPPSGGSGQAASGQTSGAAGSPALPGASDGAGQGSGGSAAGGGSGGAKKASGGGSGGGSTATTAGTGKPGTKSTTTAAGGGGTQSTTTTAAKGGGTTTSTPKPGATTTTTTSPPVTATLVVANGPGGNAGRPEQGDQVVVTFAVAPAPSAFCSSWSASSHPDLVDPNVVMNADQPSSGDDVISSVTDAVDCSGGFHFGSIDLGQRGYFNNAQTIGGPGAQCSATVTTGCTRIHWDGSHTLTITLGAPQNGEPTQKAPVVAVYTPDPALGVGGTISSAKSVLF